MATPALPARWCTAPISASALRGTERRPAPAPAVRAAPRSATGSFRRNAPTPSSGPPARATAAGAGAELAGPAAGERRPDPPRLTFARAPDGEAQLSGAVMEAFAPVAAARPRVRPSGWWYVATLGVVGLGLVVTVLVMINGYDRTERVGRDVTVVALGRSGPVTFEKGGDYTLAYQGPPQARTEADVARLATELDPVLRPAGGGPPVEMQPYEGVSGIVNGPGRQLVPVLTFEIDRPGEYVLTVEPLDGVTEDFGQVSVGKSVFGPLRDAVVWALVVLVVSLFLSGVATVALAVTRGRSKRQIDGPPGAGGGRPGGRGWMPPPGPGPWAQSPPTGPWPAPAAPPPPPGYRRLGPGR